MGQQSHRKRRKLKIAFLVNQVATTKGFEDVTSAHVQLPLYTISLLQAQGHSIDLITTSVLDEKEQVLPTCCPEDIRIFHVTDGRRRGGGLNMHVGSKGGILPIKLLSQFLQTKAIINRGDYDIVHVFGANRMGHWAGLLSLLGLKAPTVLTLAQVSFPESLKPIKQQLWKNVSAVFTTTEFLRRECRNNGIDALLVRHGIMRDITTELGFSQKVKRHRVLFWRDPSLKNGADVCLAAFKRLAPSYPNFSFDLAVRPFPNPVEGLDDTSKQYPNVNVFRFPYKDGKSLAHFISEAACIVLPFRALSTHPQLAVLESLLTARPVITTDIESNAELITSGQNGYLTQPGDVEGTCDAIKQCLSKPEQANTMAVRASVEMRKMWHWDQYVKDLERGYKQVLSRNNTSCLLS